LYSQDVLSNKKILICGICRDIEQYVPWAIQNIEELGERFTDYHVFLYENNSADQTNFLLSEWATHNSRITFVSEVLAESELPFHRTERLALARNKVLQMARDERFADFAYLLWADLDFACQWPTDEIVNTIESSEDWNVVSANGIFREGIYRDRLAFRSKDYPLGPEVLGPCFWEDLEKSWFKLSTEENWLPVYSAFGGLAIYKTKEILPFSYGGLVNDDLFFFYKKILSNLEKRHKYLQLYFHTIKLYWPASSKKVPLVWNRYPYPTASCCEHVILHAAMAKKGFDKIFVNPNMILEYPPETE